jgi:hypothetical protein
MLDPHDDPRTEDTLSYELLGTQRGAGEATVIGRATYKGGTTSVDAPDGVRVAVEELLGRAFVDRVEADERPRGYRRSGHGIVDMLIPGMPEHFIARMRGLWLPFPDGMLVTARPAEADSAPARTLPEPIDIGPPVVDPTIRRATLGVADQTTNTRPLVASHAPDTGIRPLGPARGPVSRTDCGWLV